MIAVVAVDEPDVGGSPGVVLEVSEDPIVQIRARYADLDGAQLAEIRFWVAYPGCKVGDRVKPSGAIAPG